MISLNELKRMCREYDREKGDYPESHLEGLAVWRFIAERMELTFLMKEYEGKEGRLKWESEHDG